jgi:hypothetical protein
MNLEEVPIQLLSERAVPNMVSLVQFSLGLFLA